MNLASQTSHANKNALVLKVIFSVNLSVAEQRDLAFFFNMGSRKKSALLFLFAGHYLVKKKEWDARFAEHKQKEQPEKVKFDVLMSIDRSGHISPNTVIQSNVLLHPFFLDMQKTNQLNLREALRLFFRMHIQVLLFVARETYEQLYPMGEANHADVARFTSRSEIVDDDYEDEPLSEQDLRHILPERESRSYAPASNSESDKMASPSTGDATPEFREPKRLDHLRESMTQALDLRQSIAAKKQQSSDHSELQEHDGQVTTGHSSGLPEDSEKKSTNSPILESQSDKMKSKTKSRKNVNLIKGLF